MGHWLASIHSVAVPFEDETAFSNINTRQELQQLEQREQPQAAAKTESK